MTKSARSVLVFACYLVGLGMCLLVAPGVLLSTFGMPTPTDVWIRVVGMLVLLIAFYYLYSVRHGLGGFYKATVWARASVILFFAVFVLLGLAPAVLIVFGAIDMAGALWTHLSLRAESP